MAETNEMSIGDKWQTIADETPHKPRAMPPCEARDDVLKKARQFGVAVNLLNPLSSAPKISK